MSAEQPAIPLDRISAVAFATDGVVIDSARVHAAAWKRSFDELLRQRNRTAGTQQAPFDIRTDYLRYLHGRPHVEGVRGFLASRGILLPDDNERLGHLSGSGHSSGGNGRTRDGLDESAQGRRPHDRRVDDVHSLHDGDTADVLAARATRYFLQEIDRYGIAAYRSAVALLREVRGRGARTAVFSPSPHCARVLAAARVQKLFDLWVAGSLVDGSLGDSSLVDGGRTDGSCPTTRPEEVLLAETARRLALPPRQLAVVTDSLAGVEAARRTGIGLVIALARDPDPPRRDWAATLRARGAQIVVRDLAELAVLGRRRDLAILDP
jgi:beta-phosphoglucomutase-like phosphatase (HAD superfamily)